MPGETRTVSYDPERQTLKLDDRRDQEDLALDRHLRRIVFYLVIALLVLATLGSAYLAFLVPASDANHADKEWARSILTSVIAGVVGYAFGRK